MSWIDVWTGSGQVRTGSQIARRFDNGEGEPVYYGSHRGAQGVIVPVEVWEKLLEQAEDELDLASARQRLAHDDGRG